MTGSTIKIFLLSDKPSEVKLIEGLLRDVKNISLETGGFEMLFGSVKENKFKFHDVVLLDFADFNAAISHASPDIPVIALLKGDDKSAAEIVIREGAHDFLYKRTLSGDVITRSAAYSIETMRARVDLNRFFYIIEQIPYSVVMTDIRGKVIYVNTKFIETTGCSRMDLIKGSISWIKHDRDPKEFNKMLLEFFNSEKTWSRELISVDRGGKEHWEHENIWPVRNREGVITNFIAAYIDITARKNEEHALAMSEEKYRTLVDNINEYIYSVRYIDGEAVSTYHSPRCDEVTGYSLEEFTKNGALWFSMIFEDDREIVNKFIGDTLLGMSPATIEHRIIHKNGSVRWVSNTCTVQKTPEGKVGQVLGFILDITERKTAEGELKKLSRAVQQSPASVVITDRKGDIEYVNPKFTSLTGYTGEEALGKNPRILKSGMHSVEFYRDMWSVLASGNEWRGEFRNKKKNGELYWEYASISPIRDKFGEITHFIAVKEDITDRKKAEEALMLSEENLRERNQAMEKDLKLAQTIHRILLPKEAPKNVFLEIAYRFIPLEKVGGDYFSFSSLADGSIGVFIGDLSGHGVSSALFLSLLKSATDRISRVFGDRPDLYLSELNKILISEMNYYNFITAVYGVFSADLTSSTATFTFSNGGHPYPVFYDSRKDSYSIIKIGGTIIGMIDNALHRRYT
jgi:PAS domain S-box-containing protein